METRSGISDRNRSNIFCRGQRYTSFQLDYDDINMIHSHSENNIGRRLEALLHTLFVMRHDFCRMWRTESDPFLSWILSDRITYGCALFTGACNGGWWGPLFPGRLDWNLWKRDMHSGSKRSLTFDATPINDDELLQLNFRGQRGRERRNPLHDECEMHTRSWEKDSSEWNRLLKILLISAIHRTSTDAFRILYRFSKETFATDILHLRQNNTTGLWCFAWYHNE